MATDAGGSGFDQPDGAVGGGHVLLRRVPDLGGGLWRAGIGHYEQLLGIRGSRRIGLSGTTRIWCSHFTSSEEIPERRLAREPYVLCHLHAWSTRRSCDGAIRGGEGESSNTPLGVDRMGAGGLEQTHELLFRAATLQQRLSAPNLVGTSADPRLRRPGECAAERAVAGGRGGCPQRRRRQLGGGLVERPADDGSDGAASLPALGRSGYRGVGAGGHRAGNGGQRAGADGQAGRESAEPGAGAGRSPAPVGNAGRAGRAGPAGRGVVGAAGDRRRRRYDR